MCFVFTKLGKFGDGENSSLGIIEAVPQLGHITGAH